MSKIFSHSHVDKVILPPVPNSVKNLDNLLDEDISRLDWNEATAPPAEHVLHSIAAFLARKNSLNWYADPYAKELRKQLSRYLRTSADRVMVTNGSSQAHELICNAYLREGDEIIIPVPTYSTFKIWPTARGAKIIDVPYDVHSEFDVNLVLEKIGPKTKMIYIINPYIMTYVRSDIAKIAGHSGNTIVIVDEAYGEFYGKSAVSLVRKFPNIIVTRTFSKAFMLAGLRLGYMVANKRIIDTITKIRPVNSVNALSHVAGVAAIKDPAYMRQYVAEVNKSMALLLKELPKLNFEVIRTVSGFLLFRHRFMGAAVVQKSLESENIFVRYPVSQAPGWLRMNIGAFDQTKRLIKKFIRRFAVKAIFLDRDGTIICEPPGNEEKDKIIGSVSALRILPHTINGLKLFTKMGYVLFVVSNQEPINQGYLSIKTFNNINKVMTKKFKRQGIAIDRWMVCPHEPSENCECRKPKPGMIKSVLNDYYIDLQHSYVIGDRESDVLLGRKFGMKTVLVKWNEKSYAACKTKPTLKAENLFAAAQLAE